MSATKLLADNRRARHEYFLTEPLECGMVLLGTEVKSMKDAQFSFNDAWIEIDAVGELWIRNLHINPYKQAGKDNNHDPDRRKKLLAQKKEIKRLRRQCDEKGFTLIPSNFHLKNGRIKVEICLAKGKKDYDKRATIKEKDVKRDLDRELGRR
ncbi:MAG: SsrA-binding protein SmpB [Spirochaetales bacterium]